MNGGHIDRCVGVLLVVASGCGRSRADAPAEGRPASSSIAAVPPASSPGAPAGARPTVAWTGVYKTSSSDLYIPPDWKDVHWKVKETSAGIGEGAITIHVDPATGRVLGTLEGPLGPATIDGLASAGKLTATIARSDPSDEGFAGTIVGSIADDRVDGKMYVSLAAANAIRTATFNMSAQGDQKALH